MCSLRKLNILLGSWVHCKKIVTAHLQWTDIRYVFSLHDSEYYNARMYNMSTGKVQIKMVSLIEISCKVIKIIFVNFSLNYLY